MNLHLAEIAEIVAPGAHAVLLVDQAGWHLSTRLVVPSNITIIALPSKCPELNPVENVWQFMRDNWLSNRIFKSYDDLVDHCCEAWNKLIDLPSPIDQNPCAHCLSVVPFSDFDKAISGANDMPFGLSAGIFTSDLNRGLKAARSLRFGAIHLNETSSARADAMPFGGVKALGFGHEGPKYAIRELTEERLVTFNPHD